jgi:hypothetical protein
MANNPRDKARKRTRTLRGRKGHYAQMGYASLTNRELHNLGPQTKAWPSVQSVHRIGRKINGHW